MDRIRAAEVFVTVVERGSMAAAAEVLDMSRAMVTRYLAEMEAWAGARLLHRTTRRLSLTAAGEATLARSQQLLMVSAQMHGAADLETDEPRGSLRLACAPSLAQASVTAAVAQYLQRHPHTTVDLQLSYRAVNLVEERIDLALRITSELETSMIARPLAVCQSVVCAAPAYLQRHGTPRTVAELSQHNCLAYSYHGRNWWRFEAEAGQPAQAVAVSGNLMADDSMALLQAALHGAGISLQPRYSAAPHLHSGELVELLPQQIPQDLAVYGVYLSRDRQPATLRTMLDFLVRWFQTDAQWLAAQRRQPGSA
ncbi:MAG: LysR family transcriptional regulator [Burkholderiaceae bacterium]|jgi:DNA-binding transcriptional LysR family regulator|nr:LysR family transcriptional regulator [Burkholderiaceae bacterium]